MKKIRRDVLKRGVESGKYEIKCNHHMTDDYAFDNSNNFGKTDWMPGRIRHPKWEEITLQNGCVRDVLKTDDLKPGYMNMMDFDFTSSYGLAYYEDDGTIRLIVDSNLSFSLREVKSVPDSKKDTANHPAGLSYNGSWTWVKFDNKPSPEVLAVLKSLGGRFSGKRSAWYFTTRIEADQLQEVLQ
jgi:hypothetical protein